MPRPPRAVSPASNRSGEISNIFRLTYMASEPNQNMDELLKAYAQKRRQQARAPFELPPISRDLLQAEVARRNDKTARRDSPACIQRISAWWPRLAMVGSAAAVALVGVLI